MISLLNKRLLCIKVPEIISRCPRSLGERGTWKGTWAYNLHVHAYVYSLFLS